MVKKRKRFDEEEPVRTRNMTTSPALEVLFLMEVTCVVVNARTFFLSGGGGTCVPRGLDRIIYQCELNARTVNENSGVPRRGKV